MNKDVNQLTDIFEKLSVFLLQQSDIEQNVYDESTPHCDKHLYGKQLFFPGQQTAVAVDKRVP